ncbi:MAG: N-acylglucosamine 2-epimerase [Coprococcus sp.]|nr:N-acylglucosamine 2-epimerase [Coprococcus sp.]
MQTMVKEIRRHLESELIPFWEGLKDEKFGGYYGYMGYDLNLDKTYEKGCILNSRILWFFSNAYMLLGDGKLKEDARHAYEFLRDHCLDREYGGVFWSVACDGRVKDDTKHTYNQAFAIYALSSYYDAVKEEEALELAKELERLIEEKCTDSLGYQEAFTRDFRPRDNEKLSENGVMAQKTMNTLLHVFEAYTELYRVCRDEKTAAKLRGMMDTVADRVYNPKLGRQEVFFDKEWNPLIDLYSYGHDIEAAWLIDRGVNILGDPEYEKKLSPITNEITKHIYERAFDGKALMNEAENGVQDKTRVWWVQAEGIVGFLNGYQKEPDHKEYLNAAETLWEYIKAHLIDQRNGSEWFWAADEKDRPIEKPIVEPWKCPYHNGRMCMEVIRRIGK